MNYDPLPPLDSIESYSRPVRCVNLLYVYITCSGGDAAGDRVGGR